MRVSRRIAAFIMAAAMGAPGVATAQTTTIPRGEADVSHTPPVPLAEGTEGSSEGAVRSVNVRDGGRAAAAAGALPSTGSDPRVLFLCGMALTLLGVGLRLRTADADLY
jgi:hypothetical protein